jgi:hypothetical protein
MKRPQAPPAPANAVDAGGNLRESDLRTTGKPQFVIEWRMLKRLRAGAGLVSRIHR